MPPEKKETPTESEASRITTGYAKDFKAKVKVLQARFTGKYRRALYEALKAKGVISADYSTEMWDNDFKAWRKNPNNGIFRHLEMAGAILEEAQIPAFQVFGGPHAKDTDEVVNGISTRVIRYLDSFLEGFKTYRKNPDKTGLKQERIINGEAFKKMDKIYDLIKKHFGPWETHEMYPIYFDILSLEKGLNEGNNRKYAPFFFLFAWSNLTNSKADILNDCIYKLCNKIFSNSFDQYYYAYFSQNFPTKKFLCQGKIVTGDCEIFFDIILNQALVIAYQLNAITQVYDLYTNRKTVTITKKREKNCNSSSANEKSTNEEFNIETQKDPDDAPINPIYNMAKRTTRHLRISIPKETGNEKELIEAFKQKLEETRSFFCDFAEILEISRSRKMYNLSKEYNGLPLEILKKMNAIIKNLQDVVHILNTPGIDDTKKFTEYYVITEKRKEPIKIRKEYYTLVVTDSMVSSFDSILSDLKYSMDGMSVQNDSDQAVGEKNQDSSLNNQNNKIAPNKNQSDNLSQKPQEETQKDQEGLDSPKSPPAMLSYNEITPNGGYITRDRDLTDDLIDADLLKEQEELENSQDAWPNSVFREPQIQEYLSSKRTILIHKEKENNKALLRFRFFVFFEADATCRCYSVRVNRVNHKIETEEADIYEKPKNYRAYPLRTRRTDRRGFGEPV